MRARAAAVAEMVPARPTALLFASLLAGQVLNLISISICSAALGLEGFGRYGVCLLDFTVFSNIANLASPVAAIALAVRTRFADRAFSLIAGARAWSTLAAAAVYLAFEAAFRDRGMFLTALALAPALLFNATQLEWWSVARGKWLDLVAHRLLGGAATLALTWFWVRTHPTLMAAAGAFAGGAAAAFAYLLFRAASGGRGLPWPWAGPRSRRARALWRRSLPLTLAYSLEFLFLPLGFYAFRAASGDSPYLGAYGAAYRVILGVSQFAAALLMVLLPRLAARPEAASHSLRRAFDGMALAFALPLAAAPFLSRPLLLILFRHAGWDEATLRYAAWALSVMGLSTYLHLLRMPPISQAMAAGRTWDYCGRLAWAGAVNAAAVVIGLKLGGPAHLPAWSLAGDFAFTAAWMGPLFGPGRGRWLRAAGLLAGAAAYLAWAARWA
jgi:O-antigen/teichoic acid export membrane protein